MTAHGDDLSGSHSSDAFPSVAIIIPALNEEESLPLVLCDLPTGPVVYVVDNGSTDGTARVAREHGAVVIEETQRGYGSACLAGMAAIRQAIAEGDPSPDIVVFLDADYSDHPDRLPDLIAPIVEGEADFVLSSRLTGLAEQGAMPPQARYGNKLACGLMRLLLGVRHTDLGPFRAIRYASLEELGMVDRNYGWTVEMQIKAARKRLRTFEIPLPYRRRIGTSKISGTVSGTVKAGYKILATIARYGLFDRG